MSLRGAVGDAAIPYINVRLLRFARNDKNRGLAMTYVFVIARGRSPRGNLIYTIVRLLRAKALVMTTSM